MLQIVNDILDNAVELIIGVKDILKDGVVIIGGDPR